MDRLLASIALVALIAGCAAPVAPLDAPEQQAGRTVAAAAGPALVPEARSTVASVMFREHVADIFADMPLTESQESLPDRDVAVHYGGVQPVLDEFGRSVPAYVFRYDARVFVGDGHDARSGTWHGHYEEHEMEFAFDAADGRFLGAADLAEGTRTFAPPEMRASFAGGVFAFMHFHVHPDPTEEVLLLEQAGRRYLLSYQAVEDIRPLQGDCQVYEARLRIEPEPDGPAPRPEADEERMRSLVCIEAGTGAPLWTWDGLPDAFASTERLTAPFDLAPLAGEPLPPVAYPAKPWQQATDPAGLAGPTLTPPSGGGDWAEQVAARAQAAYLDPGYLLYRGASGTPAVQSAFVGFGGRMAISINDVALPTLPAGLAVDSFLDVSDGREARMEMFLRTHGLLSDGTLLPMPGAAEHEDHSDVDTSALPALPTARAVQEQLAALLPPGEGATLFYHFAFGQGEQRHERVYWIRFVPCGAEGGGLALVDAIGGHAVVAARFRPDAQACQSMAAGQLALDAPTAQEWLGRLLGPAL